MPAGYNKKDNEQSITHSAVSQGTIIIRNENEQKQDINELSRDTEHASNELKHIFDKEKEQSKIDQTRLVSEISGETLTMLNTIDRIKATEEAKKAVEDKRQKSDKPLTDKEQQEIYKEAYDKAMNEGMSAMGSNTRQGIDMAINIINGLITGDMTGAVAGALAPKLATIIKQQTGDNKVANTISHAILGAVVAELQGNSAVVGGVGAAVSERGAEVIASILYPNKSIDELNQDEKQQVSALAQLATGLAIAALGGDAQDINTAIASGKNAVENNGLTRGAIKGLEKGYESCMKIASCRNALMQLGLNFGLTNAQIEEAMRVGQTRDINQIKELTPEQIAWLDAQILAKKGLAPIMFGDETFGDRIYNESSGGNDNNNNKLGGVGAITASGAPGLPPDDDHNNKGKSSASEDKSQTTSNGYKVSNGADKVIDKADLENPIVQSRINIQNGDSAKGWNHVLNRHFNSNSNASQFTISEAEAKSLIGSDQVRNVPISNTRFSTIKGTNVEQKIYERVITLDKNIGVDKFTGRPTNTITILTDRSGNLITATPGRILP